MRVRPLICVGAVAALAVPAVALAEGLAPHSSYYNQHPYAKRVTNDVSLVVQRKRGKATVFVSNACLGRFGNAIGSANVSSVSVHRGKLAYHGKAFEYNATGSQKVSVAVSGTVTKKKASGKVTFPGTKCGTIHFVAKLVSSTP